MQEQGPTQTHNAANKGMDKAIFIYPATEWESLMQEVTEEKVS